ncbi:MAG: hypothetical protein ACYTFQ_23195 [Planctomycetota bacterium]
MRNIRTSRSRNRSCTGTNAAKSNTPYERRASLANRSVQQANPYITIYDSVIRIPAGLSLRAGDRETGGDLWGWYTRSGRPLVQLITGPGPNAVHESAHYAQDLTFFKNLQRQLSERFGCQWLGTWHGHNHLGLREPSQGDVQQVMGVTKRNGFDRWCEFITTFENSDGGLLQTLCRGRTLQRYRVNRVRIDAYDYREPRAGRSINARLRVLPGFSPLRLALLHDRTAATEALAEEAILFPLSHILFDPYQEEDAVCAEPDECLQVLSEQCTKLPENVQESIRFTVEEQSVSLLVDLPHEVVLAVRYRRTIPLKVVAVSIEDNTTGDERDLTEAIRGLGRRPSLETLYEFAVSSHAQTDANQSGKTDTCSSPLT